MIHPENDPRVETVKYELAKMLGYTSDGATKRAVKLLNAVDAADPLRAIPRPLPGDVVVTDEMLEEAMTVWHTAAGELREMLRDNYRAMAAVAPRNRPVEPVAGDAVEAALDEFKGGPGWRNASWADAVRRDMGRALALADRARGRTFVTWRRPEEFIRTLPSEPSRNILAVVNGGAGYEDYRDIREHRSEFDLSDTVLAWAEEVQIPEWVAAAMTVTDGERAPKPEPSDTTPINMLLWCPRCHTQHVDAPDRDWTNPPHRSHLCHHCGIVWRPADVETNGVARIETVGSGDTWTNRAAVLAGGDVPDWPQALRCADCSVPMIAGASDVPDAILWHCPECHYEVTDLRPGSQAERTLREVALDVMRRRRWFQPDNYDRLIERERDDPTIRSLITTLAHCYSIDEAMRTMVEAIIHMSLANMSMQKLLFDALALQPSRVVLPMNKERGT